MSPYLGMEERYGQSSLKEKKKKAKFRPPPKILYSQANGNYRYLEVDAANSSPVTKNCHILDDLWLLLIWTGGLCSPKTVH